MKNKLIKFLALFTAIFIVFGAFQPVEAQAKTTQIKKTAAVKTTTKYKITVTASEQANPADIATRCLIPGMIALHASTVKTMEADIAKYGKGHDSAVKTYRDKIDIVWSAMQQPYCGFGSEGMVAVKHSYNKSVDRIRSAFLSAAK